MNNLREKLLEAKEHAISEGVPARRKDQTLYKLLAECLHICEFVQLYHLEDQLRSEIAVSVDMRGHNNYGKGRRYTERSADVFILVCRFVLEGVDNRNSIYRYAAALREAHRRNLKAGDLEKWLLNRGGGVNHLFRSRERAPYLSRLRVLHLNQKVVIPESGKITLTLQRDEKGDFDVESTE